MKHYKFSQPNGVSVHWIVQEQPLRLWYGISESPDELRECREYLGSDNQKEKLISELKLNDAVEWTKQEINSEDLFIIQV